MSVNPHGKYRVKNPEKIHPDSSHGQILSLIPPGQKVLELGPGPATITRHLQRISDTVVVVENDQRFVKECEAYADQVICGDLEDPHTWERLKALVLRFDVIVCADILEHLKDPWSALRQLKELLSERGKVVASIPNIAHWSVRWFLLTGRFPYEDEGLLDRTHLRFFTYQTARELFKTTGYRVTHTSYTTRNDFFFPIRLLMGIAPGIESRLNKRFPNLFGYQIIIEAVPALSL